MPRIIRRNPAARRWLRDQSKAKRTHVGADGIEVKGHCVGVVGRAFTGGPAGFYDAHAMQDAVRKAGKLRRGKAPVGAIVFWKGGKHGHVAVKTYLGTIWTNDLPVTGLIGRVAFSDPETKWGYTYTGWCWATDVPGWYL